MLRTVLLDRDGVLTVESGRHVTTPEELSLLPGAAEAVARLTRSGLTVCVVTNQSGVGRGLLTARTLDAIHARLCAEIAQAGGRIEAVYACPHHPDAGCVCRKPRPGLLHQAFAGLQVAPAACCMVGDSPRDIAAAEAAGCRAVLVLSGHTSAYVPSLFPAPQPDCVAADLPAATAWILSLAEESGE